MAFNWEDFATGFLEQTNLEIDERAAEAEQLKRDQKAEARRNAPLVQQRQARARQASQLGVEAKALGATDEQLAIALNSGVAGIQDFTIKLREAAKQQKVKKLSQYDIEAIVDMPNIPSIDMSYEDMVEQVYGSRPSQPVAQAETPFWAKALGLSSVQDAERELATESFAQGMTVQQINDMVASSDYRKIEGMEGSYATYVDLPVFNSEQALDFVGTVSKTLADVESSRDYILFKEEVEDQFENEKITAEQLENQLAEYVVGKANLETSLIGMGDSYKSSFFKNPVMQKFFDDYLPEGMLERVSSPYMTPISEETVASEQQEQPENGEIVTTILPPAGTPEPAEAETVNSFEPLTTEEKALINKSLGNFAIFSDAEDKYVEFYTRDQWKNMKRSERKRLGLPESSLGGMNIYFRDEIQEILDGSPKSPSRKTFNQTRYKVKVRGKIGAFHVTKEQFEAMEDKWFEGDRPELTAEFYEEDEDNVKKLSKKLLKRYGVGGK